MKSNELLRRYVDSRSESAFAELVGQHIDLVYSSALRQVNGNAPAAQDITQAVFTELARKAPGLTQHTSLAGWLYTCTRNLAAKTFRSEQRRRIHEQEAHAMNQLLAPNDPELAWQELRPMLDEAMHDLTASDREAILLRYFERLPLAEVGARLGLKENAAHMRIGRAMDRLRAALARRGVTSTATALSVVLTFGAVSAAPAGLAGLVSQTAVASATVGGLGWGLLKLAGLMKGTWLPVGGGAALLAGLVVLPQVLHGHYGTASLLPSASAPQERAASSAIAAVPAVAGASSAAATSQTPARKNLVVQVVANDTGKPVAGANLAFWFWLNNATNRPLSTSNITADMLGRCEIPVSLDAVALLGVGSRVDGFVDTAFVWFPDKDETIPRQYTMSLDNATPIGGRVLDDAGNPVAGADVAIRTDGTGVPEDRPFPPHTSTSANENVLTDADGRWSLARISRKAVSALTIQVIHPDYVRKTGFSYMNDPEIEKSLLAGVFIYRLDRGLPASGIIVDGEGRPVAGARIVAVPREGMALRTTNQADGTFTLKGCTAGPARITAEAPGFAQTTLDVVITANPAPLRLELRRGNLVRLRVVDTEGRPIANATVRVNSNRGEAVGPAGRGVSAGQFPKRTDTNGLVLWDSAPAGDLFAIVRADGYLLARDVPAKADGKEHQITLRTARVISGSVRDAATGQPVAAFRVWTGELEGTNVTWRTSRAFGGGTFRFPEDGLPGPSSQKYKFSADGHASSVTRVVGQEEGDPSFDVSLFPSPATKVTILLPDGRPANNASVGIDVPGMHLDLKPGGFSTSAGGVDLNVFSTDAGGRFSLQPDESVTRVIAASPEGYAEATPAALATNATMRLQPWARLEGTFVSGGKPAVGRLLALGLFDRFFNMTTDADGHFVLPKAPPGEFKLYQIISVKSGPGTAREFHAIETAPMVLRLGETTTNALVLYSATARLRLPAGATMESNWIMRATAYQGDLSERFKESDDGSWRVEDLPAGDYTMYASIGEPAAEGSMDNPALKAKMSFKLPGDTTGGMLDLGEIVFQAAQ